MINQWKDTEKMFLFRTFEVCCATFGTLDIRIFMWGILLPSRIFRHSPSLSLETAIAHSPWLYFHPPCHFNSVSTAFCWCSSFEMDCNLKFFLFTRIMTSSGARRIIVLNFTLQISSKFFIASVTKLFTCWATCLPANWIVLEDGMCVRSIQP